MPNHTAQLLTVTGNSSKIEELKKLVTTDKSDFDHNTFFPMPEELLNTSSPVIIQTQSEIDAIWAKYNKDKAEGRLTKWELDEGKPWVLGITRETSDTLVQKYGFNNWYDWANHNWGTKWGIYGVGKWNENSISFSSAWSPANKMIQKLSTLFPDLSFVLDAADEGGGFVCRYIICDGTETVEEFSWDSSEGVEIRKSVGYYHDEDEEDSED